MKRLLLGLVAAVLVACNACTAPPAPAPVPPSPPPAGDASFEATVCAELAAAGCALGSSTSCPSTLAANRIPGGYLTPWAACLYSGAAPSSCAVPCQ